MILDILLALLGGSAILLVSREDKWQKYGYVLGLLTQPIWFYISIKHEEWGMFVLNLWYTFAWIKGIIRKF